MQWSVQSIRLKYKCFCWSVNVSSSFRSFIVSRNYLIWLLSDIVSSEGFSLAWRPIFIFRYRYSFPQRQTCTALVLAADCTERSCSTNIVIFDKFLIFHFSFSQFWTIISSSFFLDKYSSIFDVVIHKSH